MAASRRSSRLQQKQISPVAATVSRQRSLSNASSRSATSIQKSPVASEPHKKQESLLKAFQAKAELQKPVSAVATRQLRTRRVTRGNASRLLESPNEDGTHNNTEMKELEAKENTAKHNQLKLINLESSSDEDISEKNDNEGVLFEFTRYCDSPINFDNDLSNVGEFLTYAKLTDINIHYMIGFERFKFEFLYTCIMNTKLKFPFGAVPILDQLFITLFKFRHDNDFKLIALMFGLPNELAIAEITDKWTVLLIAFLNMVGFKCVDISGSDLHAVIRDTTEILLKKSQNFSNTPRMSI